MRELSHAIERAVLMSTTNRVKTSDLGLQENGSTIEQRLEHLTLDEMERQLIKKALAKFDGNAVLAANALGLSRSAFYRRLEKYRL